MSKRWIALVVSVMVLTAAPAALFAVNAGKRSTERTVGAREQPRPRVEITQPSQFEFGKMKEMQTYSHAWEVKNVGDVDLEIWMESTSYRATAKLPAAPGSAKPRLRVKPKETTLIQLEWRTRVPVNEFVAACAFGTNDPKMPMFTLTAKGMVDSAEQK